MGAAAPSRAAPRAPVPAPRALRFAEPLWPRSSQAASPAGRRAPALACASSKAGEGWGWAGAHWHVGPGCQPPSLMFFFICYFG